MAESVGLFYNRVVTLDLTMLVLNMQIHRYILAFFNYMYFLSLLRLEVNLLHIITIHELIVLAILRLYR